MCWCDPNKRTPFCGGPDCHPPSSSQFMVTSCSHVKSGYCAHCAEELRIRIDKLERLLRRALPHVDAPLGTLAAEIHEALKG